MRPAFITSWNDFVPSECKWENHTERPRIDDCLLGNNIEVIITCPKCSSFEVKYENQEWKCLKCNFKEGFDFGISKLLKEQKAMQDKIDLIETVLGLKIDSLNEEDRKMIIVLNQCKLLVKNAKIPKEEIYVVAKRFGMNKEKVENALDNLRRSGDIFEPQENFVQML
jgi:hypothetical protein